MIWLFFDDKPWFAPTRFGFGTGLPIAWKGWLLMGLHVAMVTGLGLLVGDRPALAVPLILVAGLLPLPIYAHKTRGGWRWRWGGDQ